MSLANTLIAIEEHRCPNRCGDLVSDEEMSRCPACGYYTNCTPEHFRKLAKREFAANAKALGFAKGKSEK